MCDFLKRLVCVLKLISQCPLCNSDHTVIPPFPRNESMEENQKHDAADLKEFKHISRSVTTSPCQSLATPPDLKKATECLRGHRASASYYQGRLWFTRKTSYIYTYRTVQHSKLPLHWPQPPWGLFLSVKSTSSWQHQVCRTEDLWLPSSMASLITFHKDSNWQVDSEGSVMGANGSHLLQPLDVLTWFYMLSKPYGLLGLSCYSPCLKRSRGRATSRETTVSVIF